MHLWADAVMNASSRPPAENNNHNKDDNNGDNKKREMLQATAAANSDEHSSTCQAKQRHVPPCFPAGFHSFTDVSAFLHCWRREERAAASYYSFDSGASNLFLSVFLGRCFFFSSFKGELCCF